MKQMVSGYMSRKPNFRRKMRILKQSHSVEKCKMGDLLGFSKLQVAKYQKIEGDPLETFRKFFEKSHSRKKLKGGPFSLVRFCVTLKKELQRPLCSRQTE